MSDDEYDEELPPISVNCSTSSASALAMPSAEELASERAREAECERELLSLRAQHEVAMLTDSSGSEGEAALAAAVGALSMPCGERSNTPPAPAPSPLLALLTRLAPPALDALQTASADMLDALTHDVCMCVEADRVYTDEEIVFTTAWLCVRGAGAGAGAGRRGVARRARRALHHMLDSDAFENMSEEAFQRLTTALVEMTSPPHIRLEMADVLTCIPSVTNGMEGPAEMDQESEDPGGASDPGGESELSGISEPGGESELSGISEPGGEREVGGTSEPRGAIEVGGKSEPGGADGPGDRRKRLALALLWATVSGSLGSVAAQVESVGGCACALASDAACEVWRSCGAISDGAHAARAVGRVVRACSTPRRCAARAARALARAAPARHSNAHPRHIEMLVNASKLQLLFRE